LPAGPRRGAVAAAGAGRVGRAGAAGAGRPGRPPRGGAGVAVAGPRLPGDRHPAAPAPEGGRKPAGPGPTATARRLGPPRGAAARPAVHAHAGTDAKLAKLQSSVQTARGTVNFVGSDVPATREGQLSLPDRARWSFEFSQPGRKLSIVLGVNGPKGWRLGAGT